MHPQTEALRHILPAGSQSDPIKGIRVRLALLLCLQTLAKSDCRALHPHWSLIFPVQSPLQPRPLSPTVVTAMLFDPSPKVRILRAHRPPFVGWLAPVSVTMCRATSTFVS